MEGRLLLVKPLGFDYPSRAASAAIVTGGGARRPTPPTRPWTELDSAASDAVAAAVGAARRALPTA